MKQLKRCPRCGGNLFLSNETGTPEWTCLQCARTYPVVVTREGVAVAATGREPDAAGHRRAA